MFTVRFSTLDGLSQPKDIAKRCKELGLLACALTDHGNISGAIKFFEACKKAEIKPILGCELYICEHHSSIQGNNNSKLQHLVVLAKNFNGYKDLLKIVSLSNTNECFYKKPRLSLQELKELNRGNLIGISGHLGSHMSGCMFDDTKIASKLKNTQEIRKHIVPNIEQVLTEQANILIDIFGKDNFFLEIQLIDQDNLPINKVIADGLRYIGKKLNIPRVATPDAHYCKKADAVDQRLLLCNSINKTLTDIYAKIKNGEDVPLTSFFNSSNYHIPSYDEIKEGNLEDEIENTIKIGEMCEEYDITLPPNIPKFPKTNGLSGIDYLRQQIKEGFQKKKSKIEGVCNKKGLTIEDYRKRYLHEEKVIIGAENNLEHYFLIMQDIIRFAKDNGIMTGCGRGCVSSRTKVITDKFFTKNINHLKIGDKVLTCDGSFQKILNVYKYPVSEPTINIKSWYGDDLGVTMTYDHKVLAEKHVKTNEWTRRAKSRKKTKMCKNPTGDLKWVEAKDIKKHDWVFVPKPNIIENQPEKIDLYEYSKDDECIIINNNKLDHIVYNKLCNVNKTHSSIDRYLVLDKNWYKIFGIFTGDGWFSKGKNNVIGFAFHKDDKNIDFVKNIFENIGCKVTLAPHKTKKIIQLYVYNRIVYNLFKSLYNDYKYKADTKAVPEIIFQSSKENIGAFLSGYCDADGHISEKDKRITYTTISRKLADQVRLLHLHLGQLSSLNKYVRHDNRDEYKNTKPSYTIHLQKPDIQNKYSYEVENGFLLKVRKIIKKYTTKYVYDIEVENNKNYVTSSFTIHNSSSGCLISYLLDITDVDPLEYDLLFERFYNSSRKGSLPDIDSDFESRYRYKIFDYITELYGKDYVARIATFGLMKAKASLKDVLRNDNISFDVANEITQYLVDESKISDQLQEIIDDGNDDYTTLDWNIDHNDKIKKYCYRDENGKLQGDYAKHFAQAIRLNGCIRSVGMHACGLAISNVPIRDVCPLIRAKSGELVVAYSKDIEKVSLVKMDILSLNCLDKLHIITDLINNEKTNE
jgi:DNA polymerase-3 subunit alpha